MDTVSNFLSRFSTLHDLSFANQKLQHTILNYLIPVYWIEQCVFKLPLLHRVSFLFLISDTFRGAKRFIAEGVITPVNYVMARDICQKHNATLPRRTPEQTLASVNSVFMKLSALRGDYLHIWLDNCTSLGTECSIWAIDSRDSSKSHYRYYGATQTSGVHFVVCERGMSACIQCFHSC